MEDKQEIKNDFKDFGLTKQETEMIRFMRQQADAQFSALLSYIASSRLGYSITAQTQFKIDPEFTTISIREIPQPGADVTPSQPEPQESSENAIKTAE